ncbi:LamG-like jellyroll fold domain-containing protein [Bradyrhizobium elkanii]|uniref:LamG-like jellyroll fold domain-containing protein n=1 Tax=Bradyrhizobium elkanii TaxID=29448 RepID=UPI0035120DFA
MNVRPGDVLQIGNYQTLITDVTDATHLVIPAWGGGAQTNVAYTIWQWFPQRVAGAQAMADVSTLVAAMNTTGFFWFVDISLSAPDPSLGSDGQYALQPTSGKMWFKSAGTWNFLGIYRGFNARGAYDNAATYAVGDFVSSGGSSYVWVNTTVGSGHAPPNAAYWQLLASKGDKGDTGPVPWSGAAAWATATNYVVGPPASVVVGPNKNIYQCVVAHTAGSFSADLAAGKWLLIGQSATEGTSPTSLAVSGTGTKTFSTQVGLSYQNGVRLRASSNAAPTNWMEGVCTYDPINGVISMTADNSGGAGTFADWNFNRVGERGQPGNALSADEYKYWLGMAAMLDPAAYVLYTGKFSLTVPAGETLYVLNAWSCVIAGGSSSWFHRDLASSEAFEISAGTTIAWDGISFTAFLYVCRPALVMNDPKYVDPKALYFQRLNSLRSIALSQLSVTVASGSAPGTLNRVNFPFDFNDGIFAQVSVMDAPWAILADALFWGVSNTANEISDVHQYRTTKKLLTAFPRAMMPYFEVQSANVSGNATDVSTFVSRGTMAYYKLPGTWRATPSLAYRAAVLADAPSRYYDFGEVAGAVATNLGTTASADAAYVGSVLLALNGATGDGTFAVSLNSADDYISMAASTDWNLAGSDFTFEFWVRFDALPTPSASFDPWVVNGWVTSNGDTDNSFLVAVQNNKLVLLVKYADATTATLSSTLSLDLHTFYHVIVGRSGGNLFIRVVGKETRQTLAVSKNLITRNSKLTMLGNSFSGGASPGTFRLSGRLDEFAFYKSALSDARADAHHAATLGWV